MISVSIMLATLEPQARLRSMAWEVRRFAALPDLHGNVVMDDMLIPAGKRTPGRFLDNGPFVIVPGEGADRVEIREPRDGGELDLPVLIAP
jgi:hypothetical protein